MSANDTQVGGDHYKQADGGEEHWDRVARLGLDYFQACITKYIERWKKKGGIQDLEKARHYLQKYIEIESNKPVDNSHRETTKKEPIFHHRISETEVACGIEFNGDTLYSAYTQFITCPKCKEKMK